jgi:hypothetical protein
LQETLRVDWRLTPRHYPRPWRNCAHCNATTPFRCSMKFRTNAQKKRIDVWLIYRCETCGGTWNLPIFERVSVGDIAPDEFQAIAHNEPALAARYAVDATRLRQYSDRVEESSDVAVEKSARGESRKDPAVIEIALALVQPCRARLDGLLSRELGLGRGRLAMLQASAHLTVTPLGRKLLRGPVISGQVVVVALDPAAMEAELIAMLRRRALL